MGELFPQKEAPMSKDTRLIDKINSQLEQFVEDIASGLSRPEKKFVHQTLFGIQA